MFQNENAQTCRVVMHTPERFGKTVPQGECKFPNVRAFFVNLRLGLSQRV